jgi:hypothetical protein
MEYGSGSGTLAQTRNVKHAVLLLIENLFIDFVVPFDKNV